MQEPFLETRRLSLHILDASFAQQVVDYYKENRKHFSEGMPLITRKIISVSFQEERLEWQKQLMEKNRMLKLYLFEKEDYDLKQIVGDIAFDNVVFGAFCSCTLGYKLDKTYVKNGYMQEALKTAIDYMFREVKLHRVEANIRPQNKESIRLVEGLGFQKEGFSPKFLKIKGKWEDHLRFALLNDLVRV